MSLSWSHKEQSPSFLVFHLIKASVYKGPKAPKGTRQSCLIQNRNHQYPQIFMQRNLHSFSSPGLSPKSYTGILGCLCLGSYLSSHLTQVTISHSFRIRRPCPVRCLAAFCLCAFTYTCPFGQTSFANFQV